MRNLETIVNYQLNKFPVIKKIVKRAYQLFMYSINPKIKSEGNITRISPDGGECFFGYYDKSPWDITDRYMLCIRVKDALSSVAPKEKAEILLIDTHDNNSYEVLATTNTWNVQQSCMLQWLGPDYSERIIYNDFRDGQYCSVILNIRTKKESIIAMPVYSISLDGKFALSLDFSRLHRLRKGYGYSNLVEETKDEKCPDKPCIWHINLENGKVKPLLRYTDFANFEPRPEMKNAEHKINHIMISPSGKRFMVLHRWFQGLRKYTRLVTVNCDGSNMYNLSDDDMTSHCCWKNDEEILSYLRRKDKGNGYYLLKDNTQYYQKLWNTVSTDGHPSYSPDRNLITTDTYPNRQRIATIYCINSNTNEIRTVARVFAPFKYDNDVRCDLHPRWNRAGDRICFDSVFNGQRGMYVVNF
ncbi:hypothetical protein [Anaerospora sp.]|uniref:TolB family protein n=1 Tax=Anaerospora sp. TaxID=1960278 RepID=UPI00289B6BE4|nr:hypothetical protein [Anaerospora sp.]